MKIITLIIVAFALTLSAQGEDKGVHLFILSGQSNMAGLKPDRSFTPAVKKAFGEDGAMVVKAAWSGQPIRKWYGQIKKNEPWGVGHLYTKMMTKVKEEAKDRKIATVTFIWMQGEADAKQKRGDVYEKSLKGLLKQVKKDLNIETLNFVIGRLSDCHMDNKKYPHWTKVREVQVKLAEGDPNGAWVDTDDLNNKTKDGKTWDDLHYSGKGYKILGEHFAEKAIELVRKK